MERWSRNPRQEYNYLPCWLFRKCFSWSLLISTWSEGARIAPCRFPRIWIRIFQPVPELFYEADFCYLPWIFFSSPPEFAASWGLFWISWVLLESTTLFFHQRVFILGYNKGTHRFSWSHTGECRGFFLCQYLRCRHWDDLNFQDSSNFGWRLSVLSCIFSGRDIHGTAIPTRPVVYPGYLAFKSLAVSPIVLRTQDRFRTIL